MTITKIIQPGDVVRLKDAYTPTNSSVECTHGIVANIEERVNPRSVNWVDTRSIMEIVDQDSIPRRVCVWGFNPSTQHLEGTAALPVHDLQNGDSIPIAFDENVRNLVLIQRGSEPYGDTEIDLEDVLSGERLPEPLSG